MAARGAASMGPRGSLLVVTALAALAFTVFALHGRVRATMAPA